MHDDPWDRSGAFDRIAKNFRPTEEYDLSTSNVREAIGRIGGARSSGGSDQGGTSNQIPSVNVDGILSLLVKLITRR